MSRLFFLPIFRNRCYNAAPSFMGLFNDLISGPEVVDDISGALK